MSDQNFTFTGETARDLPAQWRPEPKTLAAPTLETWERLVEAPSDGEFTLVGRTLEVLKRCSRLGIRFALPQATKSGEEKSIIAWINCRGQRIALVERELESFDTAVLPVRRRYGAFYTDIRDLL